LYDVGDLLLNWADPTGYFMASPKCDSDLRKYLGYAVQLSRNFGVDFGRLFIPFCLGYVTNSDGSIDNGVKRLLKGLRLRIVSVRLCVSEDWRGGYGE
jgi:hypothetical protein